jgi:hypothetical protein
MIHVAEFDLNPWAPKSFEMKNTYHCALLELDRRVGCAFKFFALAWFSGFAAQAIA